MISFRFHIMSIVALFLAVALGVVVGSTYDDRVNVNSLESRISTVAENLDEGLDDNEALAAEVERLEAYAAASAPYAVDGRLADVPVVLVAERGVDGDEVSDLALLLDRAGADAPGILWIEPVVALGSGDDRQELQDLLDTAGSEAGGATGAGDLRTRVWRSVATELGPSAPAPPGEGGPSVEPGATEPDRGPPSPDGTLPGQEAEPDDGSADDGSGDDGQAPVLEVLIEAGYLSFEGVGGGEDTVLDLAGSGGRVLLVSGAEAEVGVEGLVADLAEDLAAAEVATVVAGLGAGDPLDEADPVTSQVRDSEELRAEVATVDHVDRTSGEVAAVLALAELGDAEVGHYGYAPGADRVIPELSTP